MQELDKIVEKPAYCFGLFCFFFLVISNPLENVSLPVSHCCREWP